MPHCSAENAENARSADNPPALLDGQCDRRAGAAAVRGHRVEVEAVGAPAGGPGPQHAVPFEAATAFATVRPDDLERVRVALDAQDERRGAAEREADAHGPA